MTFIPKNIKAALINLFFNQCAYCNKTVFSFQTNHTKCRKMSAIACSSIISEATDSILHTGNFTTVMEMINESKNQNKILDKDASDALIISWENAVECFLNNETLNDDENNRIIAFMQFFSLSQTDLNKNGWATKLHQAAILQEIHKGKIPEVKIEGLLPVINLQKNETIIWIFQKTAYLQDQVQRRYEGGSRGISIRVAKGVHYRMGVNQGRTIAETKSVHVDDGQLIITNKNLYFIGPKKSLRLPYKKIVSFTSFSNGIGITRDAVTAKPQFFLTQDGWFTYNLITQIANLEKQEQHLLS